MCLHSVLGLIKPSLVRASSRAKAFGIYSGLALVFMVVVAVIAPKQDNVAQEQVAETKQGNIEVVVDDKAKPEATIPAKLDNQAHKDAVLVFEQRMYAIEKPATAAMQHVQTVATGFDSGRYSIHDMYAAVKDAHDRCKSAWLAAGDMNIPAVLPRDVGSQLKKAREQFQVSLYCKMNGLEHFMEFLDNRKPSEVQKYKDEINSAQAFTIQAVGAVFQAKDMVGLALVKGDGNSQIK